MKQEQRELQVVVNWLSAKYPYLIVKVNYDSYKANIGHAKQQKNLKSSVKGFPDLAIYEPRHAGDTIYHALFIEYKKENEQLFKVRTPKEFRTPHLINQNRFLEKLRNKGYYAVFSIGVNDTIQLIDNYLKLEKL